ncbi:hypothetical protein EJ02DRAFT_468901 [Clathrospora elynae]|uniref:Uncharacterized protein n=1 Tax=Clathrospora elynae TaxID=706981 RepID=A0A6A5SGE8_9PLEO|nr:hypothetical protein EJ02DRAFT_468901 [Clathrospora elynae]
MDMNFATQAPTRWMEDTNRGVENWCGEVCGSMIRWGLRPLLVIVMVGFMVFVISCAYSTFGSSRRNSRKAGLDNVRTLLRNSELKSGMASFKDAGVGAKNSRWKEDDGPDVGDSCVAM